MKLKLIRVTMSKKYLILGTAFLLISCSQNEVQICAPSKTEIVFTNLNDRISFDGKSVLLGNGANSSGDDYKVFAQSELNESNWYIVDEVCGHGVELNKPKKGPYYWLGSSQRISFYAYAPAQFAILKGETVSRTKVITKMNDVQKLFIDYTVPAMANEDFTIADPINDATPETKSGAVNFNFRHVLSKVSVSVKLSDALIKSGYTIEKCYKAQLAVTKNRGTIDPTVINGLWTNLSVDNDVPLVYANDTTYTILPQLATDCTIQIKNVVIKKNGITIFPLNEKIGNLKVYSIKNGDVKVSGEPSLDNQFAMGKQYSLKFIIDNLVSNQDGGMIFGTEINFNSTIASWKEGFSLSK